MKIGFTGTQQGMTQFQKQAVWRMLRNMGHIDEAYHGDCIGSDADFHQICLKMGIPVVIHPPLDPKKRAFCKGARFCKPLPYMERNTEIVVQTDALIATPKTKKEELRSGTWATIRRARKHHRPVTIIA